MKQTDKCEHNIDIFIEGKAVPQYFDSAIDNHRALVLPGRVFQVKYVNPFNSRCTATLTIDDISQRVEQSVQPHQSGNFHCTFITGEARELLFSSGDGGKISIKFYKNVKKVLPIGKIPTSASHQNDSIPKSIFGDIVCKDQHVGIQKRNTSYMIVRKLLGEQSLYFNYPPSMRTHLGERKVNRSLFTEKDHMRMLLESEDVNIFMNWLQTLSPRKN